MAEPNESVIDRLRGKLVVSCQDYTEIMVAAAVRGGASGLRINSPRDVKLARKKARTLPIIACNKQHFPNSPVYITPSVRAAVRLVEAGADIVALDCTDRRHPRQSVAEIIAAIHAAGALALADLACAEEAPAAKDAGADILATTMAPDFDPRFIEQMLPLGLPVLAEGHVHAPEQAHQAIEAGAWAVCVGTAITRPHLLTEQFRHALGE